MNRIVERFARLKREGKKGFIVYIGAGDPNLEATRQLALAFDKLGRGCAGTGRAVQRPAGGRPGQPTRRPARPGIRHHAAQSPGNRGRHPQGVANSHCPLHLLQSDPSVAGWSGSSRDAARGGRGRLAGAGFAAGGERQLRSAHAPGGAVQYLSRGAHHAGRPHRTDRQARRAVSSITSRAKASPACRPRSPTPSRR